MLEEMDEFVELGVEAFLELVCPGHDMPQSQLQAIGDFDDMDTSIESNMYTTLVRGYLSIEVHGS